MLAAANPARPLPQTCAGAGTGRPPITATKSCELGLGASLSLQAIGVQGAAYQTHSAATGAQIGFRWAPMAEPE